MLPGIDRHSPLPFYQQLKEILTAEIKRERLEIGARIPGDHELCRRFGVSRTVVRQALAELEAEGEIERVKGRGTFVSTPKTAEGLVQSLSGLSEDVAARGSTLRSVVRSLALTPADAQVAADLEVELGHPVIELERVRFVDEVPWVLTTAHLRAERVPGLLEEDFARQSLYALLEGRYGIRMVHGRRMVEATLAGSAVARCLGISRGAPVLVLRSVSRDARDVPVERFVAYHRGDRSRFEVELTREAASARPLMVVTG